MIHILMMCSQCINTNIPINDIYHHLSMHIYMSCSERFLTGSVLLVAHCDTISAVKFNFGMYLLFYSQVVDTFYYFMTLIWLQG